MKEYPALRKALKDDLFLSQDPQSRGALVFERIEGMLTGVWPRSRCALGDCSDEHFMKRFLSPGAEVELRELMRSRLLSRSLWISGVRAELEREQKEARRTFASKQIEALVRMGMSSHQAGRIMRAAGPGRCVAAAKWAYVTCTKFRLRRRGTGESYWTSSAVLEVILAGALHSPFGLHRTQEALKALGLPLPGESSATGLKKFLAGAAATLRFAPPCSQEG